MGVYWRVSPKVWQQSWSDSARLLALYLLTCRHRNLPGLFYLPKGYILADLEWSAEQLAEPFEELLMDDFCRYDSDTNLILLTRALRYQQPQNPNQMKHAIDTLSDLPDSSLFADLFEMAKEHAPGLAERLRELLEGRSLFIAVAIEGCSEEVVGEEDQAPEDDQVLEGEVVDTAPGTGVATTRRTDGFDTFWATYPRRENKIKAQNAWARLTKQERTLATGVAEIMAQGVAAGAQERQYVPYASTFLNGKRWEDWRDGVPVGWQAPGAARAAAQNDALAAALAEVKQQEVAS